MRSCAIHFPNSSDKAAHYPLGLFSTLYRLRSQIPGEITFPIVQKNVERIILVSEEEIRAALKYLLTRMKILTEPSGAASAAAVLAKRLPPEVQRVGVILSGGNEDYEVLASL